MRTITRTLLAAGAIMIGAVASTAQAPGPRPAVLITEIPGSGFAGSARSPAAVIERLKSFDINADDRISRDELPERMQGLVARGDTNADAVLDSNEIRAFVNKASSERIRVSVRQPPSEGLPGVISDLRLPPAKQARALAIVGAYTPSRNVNDPALLGEMKAVLDDDEYENFLAAATRLSRSADFRFRTIGGVVKGLPESPVRK